MAGSILGADQIAKVNAAYPRLLAHLRTLVGADNSAYGLMKVHFLTEFLDTTEIHAIFVPLAFLAPAEKRALVRAAIYDVLITNVIGLFVPGMRPSEAPVIDIDKASAIQKTVAKEAVVPVLVEGSPSVTVTVQRETPTFTPPRFTLNVNKASAIHGQAPADINVAKPVITSTHTSKVAKNVEAGNQRMTEQQAKLDAAVQGVRDTEAKDVK